MGSPLRYPEGRLVPWLIARLERSGAAAVAAVDRLDRAGLERVAALWLRSLRA